MNKKGFMFVVTVFLILTYILLSISVWVKGIEASERAYAEFYKESTVELAIEQITPAKMVEVADVVMNRALFRLNEHTIDSPVIADEMDENENIRRAFSELLVNGSADSQYFKGPGIEDSENSSLSDWASNLNASLLAIGVYVSDFRVSNFEIRQSDMNELNYSFDLTLKLRDYANTSSVSRTYENLGSTLDVSGLVDPALARKSNQTIYRQFFFDKDRYGSAGSIEIINKGEGKGGQGWLYAPLASATSGTTDVPSLDLIASADRRNYILVGNFTEIEALGPATYKEFGGFILTNRPTVTPFDDCGGEESDTFNPIKFSDPPDCVADFGSPEVGLPFIVAPGFNVGSAPECRMLDGAGNLRCVLFINPYLPSEVMDDHELKLEEGGGVYDVESIRDFVMCGYYTHNPKAPSYLQRLLEGPYSRNSTQFGIETFVIGEYASDYGIYDFNSRLDRELFNSTIQGIKVRGLPGCKDFGMCADRPVTGVFAASSDAIGDYNLDEIDCRTDAGCSR